MNPDRTLRIAAAQLAVDTEDVAGNVARMTRLIADAGARGVAAVVFPELCVTGYDVARLERDPRQCALAADAPAWSELSRQCRDSGVAAVVGACLPRRDGVSNSVVAIDRRGERAAVADKHYLDGAEKRFFVAGADGVMLELDGWRLALGICYDASFPEFARAAALQGAHALLFAGAFLRGASDRRRAVYFPARALDNSSYVVFANFVGRHAGMDFCGKSAVYGPDGVPVAEAGADEEGLIIAELSHETLAQVRASNLMLRDCAAVPPSFARHALP